MKAGIGFCRRPLAGALAVGLIALGSSAFGQEIRFIPTAVNPLPSAPGTPGSPIVPTMNGAIGCWEYSIDAGGVEVTISIEGGGWGNAMGSPNLGAIQATIDSAGYTSGTGSALNPKGWPGSPGDGAYQETNVCGAGGDGTPCVLPFDVGCTGNGFCVGNPNFIFTGAASALCAVAFPTLDYGYACAAQNPAAAGDPGGGFFGTFGTLELEVPAGAAGTYVIAADPDPNNSFMTAGDGAPIAGVVFTPACITVITGKCCSNIGPNVACEDGLTTGQCDARPGPRLYEAGGACNGPTAADDCPSCQSDADCNDSDACTDDVCDVASGLCSNNLNYDPAVDCCNPGDGSLEAIDDGDVCTDDSCDAATGGVAHDPNTGNACDDGFACTVDDTCNAGACEGTDVNTIPCTSDADCPLGECGGALCECSEDTPLTCSVTDANDQNCYEDGEAVSIAVGIGAGSEVVFGAQFNLSYDASCLEFVGWGACPGTTFTDVIEFEHTSGNIWYAVTVDSNAPVGSPGPEDILCLDFVYVGDCDGCDPSVTFQSVNPRNTLLSNNTGNPVPTVDGECKGIRGKGEITLDVPDGEDVNADCGFPSAIVEWDCPSATDSCDGDLAISCIAEHTGGLDIQGLLDNCGGEFPQGTSFFRCEASNSCGETAVEVWTVDVSDQHGLHVEVHLSPTIVGDNFQRAIDFQLYLDCSSDPEEICEVMTFGGPFNFNGHARSWLKVDKGNYQCITAKDPLHTLRAAADVECVDNAWEAVFKGDPLQGGNWLIGGNLDCWKAGGNGDTIDILDAGMYLSVIAGNQGSTNPGANTDCSTPGPHADINADGVVDSADYSFVLENFLEASKDACCPPDPGAVAGDVPITSITFKELADRGLSALFAADINGDKVLDEADLEAYQNGEMPRPLFDGSTKQRGTKLGR